MTWKWEAAAREGAADAAVVATAVTTRAVGVRNRRNGYHRPGQVIDPPALLHPAMSVNRSVDELPRSNREALDQVAHRLVAALPHPLSREAAKAMRPRICPHGRGCCRRDRRRCARRRDDTVAPGSPDCWKGGTLITGIVVRRAH